MQYVKDWKDGERVNNRPMVVVQCWDDGVATDVRLVDLLCRHGAKATFNLNAGLHDRHRQFGWIHQGTEAVSYTHLDVYKRPGWNARSASGRSTAAP